MSANEDGTTKAEEHSTGNAFSIMLELAKACYLEDVLFSAAESAERTQISQFIEMAGRLSDVELTEHVN